MKRIVFDVKPGVRPDKKKCWVFVVEGVKSLAGVGMLFETKRDAVFDACELARDTHELTGALTQVKIRKADGEYQSERTYGLDPRRTKG